MAGPDRQPSNFTGNPDDSSERAAGFLIYFGV
jgi:hypothetical protein